MTENEAIEVLKDFGKQVSVKADGAYQSTIGEKACNVAIKALKEIQKYRKIEKDLKENYHANVDIPLLMKHFIETVFKGEKHDGFCILTNEDKEEWEEYRTIGTPEELKAAMKYVYLAKKNGTVGQVIENCVKYEEIGTSEECREAMEKQTAKKPMHVTNSYFGYQKHKEHVGYCPDCGHQVEEPYGCPNCLRKIDWGDEE
jgi:hypothetical protein